MTATAHVALGQALADHWHTLLDAVDCCYAPLLETAALATHPQLAARDAWVDIGPNYAGWIDDAPLEVTQAFTEIDDPAKLVWGSATT